MGLMVERVALAIFLSRYPDSTGFWPDRLDELVSGPPFNADGYRDMARAALEEMREPTVEVIEACASYGYEGWGDPSVIGTQCWQAGIDAALGKIDA